MTFLLDLEIHEWLKSKADSTKQTVIRVMTQILMTTRAQSLMKNGKTFHQAIQKCVQFIIEQPEKQPNP